MRVYFTFIGQHDTGDKHIFANCFKDLIFIRNWNDCGVGKKIKKDWIIWTSLNKFRQWHKKTNTHTVSNCDLNTQRPWKNNNFVMKPFWQFTGPLNIFPGVPSPPVRPGASCLLASSCTCSCSCPCSYQELTVIYLHAIRRLWGTTHSASQLITIRWGGDEDKEPRQAKEAIGVSARHSRVRPNKFSW